MNEQTTQTRLSHVQSGVKIVQDMVCLAAVDGDYHTAVARLHTLMAEFALAQIRHEYEPHLREVDPDHVLTVEEVTSEANEGTPMASAYWAATSMYFRRVFQAAAAAA